ncbi:MAG: BtpA/SgcQ family protein [Desulfobacterales bacterium]
MSWRGLFGGRRPVIACIHLPPLPGSPRYGGKIGRVYEAALGEAEIYRRAGVDGLLVENFGDRPFFPDRVPPETTASMAAVTREVVRAAAGLPVGVNVLRNDAPAALAVATAAAAHFIRVNVHLGAAVGDPGILEGRAHETLRRRSSLKSPVLILADLRVKHAAPLVARGLAAEARELAERGLADALIVTGERTGEAADPEALQTARENCRLPVLVGSGLTPENLAQFYAAARGFIVGSFFKKGGRAENRVEEGRVRAFLRRRAELEGR